MDMGVGNADELTAGVSHTLLDRGIQRLQDRYESHIILQIILHAPGVLIEVPLNLGILTATMESRDKL